MGESFQDYSQIQDFEKSKAVFFWHETRNMTFFIGLSNVFQGSHRLENYLNRQNCLEKSLKIKFAFKST